MIIKKPMGELINELFEIDNRIYVNRMRLKSIESKFERVDPYSKEFERLIYQALQIKEELNGEQGLYTKKFMLNYRINTLKMGAGSVDTGV